jgi:hypothetical protein
LAHKVQKCDVRANGKASSIGVIGVLCLSEHDDQILIDNYLFEVAVFDYEGFTHRGVAMECILGKTRAYFNGVTVVDLCKLFVKASKQNAIKK